MEMKRRMVGARERRVSQMVGGRSVEGGDESGGGESLTMEEESISIFGLECLWLRRRGRLVCRVSSALEESSSPSERSNSVVLLGVVADMDSSVFLYVGCGEGKRKETTCMSVSSASVRVEGLGVSISVCPLVGRVRERARSMSRVECSEEEDEKVSLCVKSCMSLIKIRWERFYEANKELISACSLSQTATMFASVSVRFAREECVDAMPSDMRLVRRVVAGLAWECGPQTDECVIESELWSDTVEDRRVALAHVLDCIREFALNRVVT